MVPTTRIRRTGILPALLVGTGILLIGAVCAPGLPGGFRLLKFGIAGIFLAVVSSTLLLSRSHRAFRFLPPASPMLLCGWIIIVGFLRGLPPDLTAAGILSAVAGPLVAISICMLTGPGRRFDHMVMLRALTITGALVAALVMLQNAGHALRLFELARAFPFGNPNWSAAFLAPLMVAAFILANSRSDKNAGIRLSTWGAFIVILTGLLITGSRGGIGAGVAGIAGFFIVSASPRRIVPLFCTIIAIIIAVACLASGVFPLSFLTDKPLITRLIILNAAMERITDAPVLGTGPVWQAQIMEQLPRSVAAIHAAWRSDPVRFIYNDWFSMALMHGVPALLILTFCIRTALSQRAWDTSLPYRAYICALFTMCLHGCIDSVQLLPASGLLFWTLAGLSLSMSRQRNKTPPVRRICPAGAGRAVPTVVCIAGIVVGGCQAARHFIAAACWTNNRQNSSARVEPEQLSRLSLACGAVPDIGPAAVTYVNFLKRAGNCAKAVTCADKALKTEFDYTLAYDRIDCIESLAGPDSALTEWIALSGNYPWLLTPCCKIVHLAKKYALPVDIQTMLRRVSSLPLISGTDRRMRRQLDDELRSYDYLTGSSHHGNP